MKKVTKLLLPIFALTLFFSTPAFAVHVETWTGSGTGTATCDPITIHPFFSWTGYVDQIGNPSTTFYGTWSDTLGHSASFTGTRNERTGAASGTWVMSGGGCGGTWSGTFTKQNGVWYYFSGIWELTWSIPYCEGFDGANGTWSGYKQ